MDQEENPQQPILLNFGLRKMENDIRLSEQITFESVQRMQEAHLAMANQRQNEREQRND